MAPKVEYADNLGPSRQEDGTIEGTSEEIIDNPDKATAFAISGIDEHYDIDSDNSPQPEVRANVPNVDDPSMPVNTLRAWALGLLFTILGTGINQFFSMRYPSVTISSLVAQLVAYPAGRALAHALPIMRITLFGREIALNPDHHFNIKEHALVTIMSNLSFGPSWATDIIQAQVAPAFLGLKTPVGYQFLLALTMQLFGLGMAGMAYRFIVEPPHMVWPSTLANAALFQTLHGRANPKADGWSISRYRFFVYIFAGGWLWYWLPGFLFTGLSTFAFICWAAPNNIVVNNLFGMSTGLAYLPTTFDWSQIAYNGSPLVVPFWAQANVFAGWVITFALVTPILYYTNTWYTAYLPFSGGDIYDNTGNVFNASRVVDRHGNFSPEDYKDYSPIFMPVTFALSYGISFATMTCVPTYIFLNYWKQILGAFNPQRKKDIHARLIERYPDAPWWWYAALTAIVLGLTIMVQEVYDTQMPVWGVFLAFGLAAFYLIPTGSVYAVANLNSNVLTVLGEIISGYAIPGKPVVMLIFKFYAYTGLSQAMIFASDMKLGLYMKIPRRTLFVAQLTACIVGSLTQNAVVLWMLHHVKDICESDQPNKYTCPQGRVNFSSSIVWGAVGPARLYSVGKIYAGLLHLFWLGALLPLVTFFLKKRYPNSKLLRNLHWPLFFAGTGNVPPATGINYSSAFAVSFIFNKWIRGKYPHWWAKYNYVLSAALDSGLAISAIVIFFALVFPGNSSASEREIGFRADSGGYTVRASGLPTYRGDATTAKFSMVIAREYYKPKANKIHGYIYGGSGGSLVTVRAMENTISIWSGAVTLVQAVLVSINNWSVRALASLVLQNKSAEIEEALRPGDSGDVYSTFSPTERKVFEEATALGVPFKGWETFYETGASESLWESIRSVSGSVVMRMDPTYVEDFWKKPGYLGTEKSELGDIFREEMLDYNTLITSIKCDVNNVPVELTFYTAPKSTRTYWLDSIIMSKDGEVLSKITAKGQDNSDNKTFTLHSNNDPTILSFLQQGTRVHISNRMFLAMHALHRYSVPKRSGFYGYDYLLDSKGTPIHSQRSVLTAEQIARSASGGATFSGKFNGKMIVMDNLMDVDAFPWHADWYRHQVREVYGDDIDNKFRLHFAENADHQMGPVVGSKSSRVVDFTGIYEQHLQDLSVWCETGTYPSTPTNYTVHNAQAKLPATASERKGLQPVVELSVNGGKQVRVKTDTAVTFKARAVVPPGAGKIVSLEYDFEGTGNFVKISFGEAVQSVENARWITYSQHGTFFPAVRAASHKEGLVDSPYGLTWNLDRARIVVS
ncbi:OPT family small oligopeptide transporter [Fusarium globosum]|uniref:OPT family small oligopeptide transporter n=1 Tax=Fusarium globosum TaxID=78864 RepID=A0A8H5Y2Y6_9HYPO|nr:OPT family small oligopeptide transporter [Fusarium globosum]